MIKPTVGRKVWFHSNGHRVITTAGNQPEHHVSDDTMDATILCVHGDRCVNVLVVDHSGTCHGIRSITLRQEGDPVPTCAYVEWMPYQTGQAKKQEAAA
jgi:hypothetical protein